MRQRKGEAVLASARRLFLEKGYEATTVDEIARAAHVSKATVYSNFSDKPAVLAALQLAVLVQHGGFGPLEWSLYLLLGGALAWFGWREPAMREASAVAAAVAVILLFVWRAPSAESFAPVCVALAAIFAGVPLAQIWRGHGRTLDLAQAGLVALGLEIGRAHV